MPFYAQCEGLPDTHSMWADPGSQHEAVLQRIGYVQVSAPGQPVEPENAGETGDEVPTEQSHVEQREPVKPRGKARS